MWPMLKLPLEMLRRGKKVGGLLGDSYPRFYTNPGVERRVRASCRKREPFAPLITGCSGQGSFVMAHFRHLWSVLEDAWSVNWEIGFRLLVDVSGWQFVI